MNIFAGRQEVKKIKRNRDFSSSSSTAYSISFPATKKYRESSRLDFSDAAAKLSKPKLIGTAVLLARFPFGMTRDCTESPQMPGLAKFRVNIHVQIICC